MIVKYNFIEILNIYSVPMKLMEQGFLANFEES